MNMWGHGCDHQLDGEGSFHNAFAHHIVMLSSVNTILPNEVLHIRAATAVRSQSPATREQTLLTTTRETVQQWRPSVVKYNYLKF